MLDANANSGSIYESQRANNIISILTAVLLSVGNEEKGRLSLPENCANVDVFKNSPVN